MGQNEKELVQKIASLETYVKLLVEDRDKVQANNDAIITMKSDIEHGEKRFKKIEAEQGRMWKNQNLTKKYFRSEVKKFRVWREIIMKDFPSMRDDYKDLRKMLFRFGVGLLVVGMLAAVGVSIGFQFAPF